jgi:AcrR family transcriptional regulator
VSAAPPIVADLRAARAAMEADTRAALLAAAAAVLSEEGPAALTVRRVAEQVNGSTKMIYTHFGGKDGLTDALYRHSFATLMARLEAEPAGPPAERLHRMTATYRAFALAEPALYGVMFGDLGRAWEPPLASRREAWRSFGALRDTVRRCLPESRADEATRTTHLLWAAMHGIVGLELRKLLGHGENGAELFALAVAAVLRARGVDA